MMRIGLDFDNTIVCYDGLFHRVALEQGLIPDTIPVSKTAVRNYLRSVGQEERWTLMQGEVYGQRMVEADAFPGAIDFIKGAASQGIELAIVSHRTRHPALGPAHDLHAAGQNWIAHHLTENGTRLIPTERVFFETTKEAKVARIAAAGCQWFVDDLPEILQRAYFPASVRPLLFDPQQDHGGTGLEAVTHWDSLAALVAAR